MGVRTAPRPPCLLLVLFSGLLVLRVTGLEQDTTTTPRMYNTMDMDTTQSSLLQETSSSSLEQDSKSSSSLEQDSGSSSSSLEQDIRDQIVADLGLGRLPDIARVSRTNCFLFFRLNLPPFCSLVSQNSPFWFTAVFRSSDFLFTAVLGASPFLCFLVHCLSVHLLS